MTTLAAAPTLNVPALQLFSLRGKNALITGGTRGIGAAMAHALADAGASLCMAQRDVVNTTTADEIRAKGAQVKVVSCDLANFDDAKGVFQKALDVMDGRIDILVNCGGLLKRYPAFDVTEEDWDSVRLFIGNICHAANTRQVINVNQKALFFVCQAAGRHMVPRRSGKIVNVASINSFIGAENLAPYSASKGAVAQLTKALSNEWAKHNIQVNAIAPGAIETDM